MQVQSLGHVVLRVRNQERAEAFYNGVLGIPIAARFPRLSATFFTLGNHHDFAVVAAGEDAPAAAPDAVGLVHVAFRLGGGLDALRAAQAQLRAAGVAVQARDHVVSTSIYFNDPDGNCIELYVDTSEVWKQDPQAVANSIPIEL